MHTLTHFRLCPHSRSIRIALDEIGLRAELKEEAPWAWRREFLTINPAGELPVLQIEGGGPILCGSYAISEYLAEAPATASGKGQGASLFSGDAEDRAEVRRLVDWFHGKLNREVTRDLLQEKVYSRLDPEPSAPPDANTLRAARANLRYHLGYLSYLAHQRRWLAGEEMSFADIAAAAHLSAIDYLGEVPWDEHSVAKGWYQRFKSRPSFRSILADRIAGMPPPRAYADLDF